VRAGLGDEGVGLAAQIQVVRLHSKQLDRPKAASTFHEVLSISAKGTPVLVMPWTLFFEMPAPTYSSPSSALAAQAANVKRDEQNPSHGCTP